MNLETLMVESVGRCESDPQFADRCDVAIIGGGIAGISAALYLSKRGIDCAVFEKGLVAGEQSSRNSGWCRIQMRDPREMPLALESREIWRSLNEWTGAETGYREHGRLGLAKDEAALASFERWLDKVGGYDHGVRLLGRDETNRLVQSGNSWAGALFGEREGYAEPKLAVPAMARTAQAQGARIYQNCAVRTVEREAGRVAYVVTERGAVRCGAAIVAGGVWSTLFCRNLGIKLPQVRVYEPVLRTEPANAIGELSLAGPGFLIRKRVDGGYTIASAESATTELDRDCFRFFADYLPMLRYESEFVSLSVGARSFQSFLEPSRWKADQVSPFERTRILHPKADMKELRKVHRLVGRLFPGFANIRIKEAWAGIMDVTPDAVPVISDVAAFPGLFLSTGFSGHGFGLGPAAGRLAADLVTGAKPVVDTAPYAFSRLKGKLTMPSQV